jgi:hypothetical protein
MFLQPEVSEEEPNMNTFLFKNMVILAFLVIVSAPGIGFAEVTGKELATFEVMEAVDNDVLDSMRGGFMAANGVRLDIGVEKASYVDGVLQVQNAFRLEDIDIQGKGFGASVSPNELQNISSALNTVIQNNLDQKTVQNLTVIDVNVNNFTNLRNGFVDSIRGLQDIQVVR